MRILAIERDLPIPPHANLPDILRAEAATVWDLQKRDIVRDLWITAADRRAILLLECPNVAEARQHLATLPLVQYGLIDFDVHELRSYDGFERLFSSGTEPPPRPKHEEPAEY